MLQTRWIISLVFFLSGAAGLIYEVVWAKQLALLFGNTAQAHTVVLATFMGGLAAGYGYFGKIADKKADPLRLYAWMEMAMGLLGALTIPLLQWLDSAYFVLAGHFGLGSPVSVALKLAFSVLLIFPATFFMGGTLPVLSRFSVRSLREVRIEVGRLYFLNSLGAGVGSLLAGFVLIPAYGLNLATLTAAALNMSVGLAAWGMQMKKRDHFRESGSTAGDEKNSQPIYSRLQVIIVVVGIALSGAAALFYEIAWIRLLALVMGSSTYSFSLMLAAFITGIALGGLAASRSWMLRANSFVAFIAAELAVAVAIIVTLPLYERLPFYFAIIASFFARVPQSFWLYELAQLFICFCLMLIPTFFLGMTLPLASQIAARSFQDVGQSIGEVFSANIAGTIVGAATGGLVLLPLLGMKGVIEVGVFLQLVVGTSALGLGTQMAWGRKGFVVGACYVLFAFHLYYFPNWDKSVLTSGVFRGLRITDMSYQQFKSAQREKLLYYKDGANMTVTVSEFTNGSRTLKVNGKPDASTAGDLATQILLAQMPLLIKPDARAILVIGLGSGVTAGSALTHPVTKLDLVEISPEVVEANRFFSTHNRDALKDPRLKLHIDDGKTFLGVTPSLYDIVISEPSNPWIAGVANLFSREFYRDVRKRLRPGGIMVQWFHIYEMTNETLQLVLRTFTASFEHVTLWSPKAGDLMLIGARAPLTMDFKKAAARLDDPNIRHELSRVGIGSLTTALSLQVATDRGIRRAAGKGRVHEDGFPILEYEAPKAFFIAQPADLLNGYDERLQPRADSKLYLAQHIQTRALAAEELGEMTVYHLTQGSLGQTGLSKRLVEAWLEHSPDDHQARWIRFQMEQGQGVSANALEDLRSLLKADPTQVEYLAAAAETQFRLYLNRQSVFGAAKPDQAVDYLQRLLGVAKDNRAAIYQKLAQVQAIAGDWGAAWHYLEEGAADASKKGDRARAEGLWLMAAQLAEEKNDVKKALQSVRTALALNPKSGPAQQKLEQLLSAAR